MIYVYYSLGILGIITLLFGLIMFIRFLLYKIVDKRIASFQNNVMSTHFHEVENMYQKMRGWKHDYHNHIHVMKAHISLSQIDQLDSYLGKLDDDLLTVDTIVKSGNIMVDAILNSKLSLAMSNHISINVKAIVPPSLLVSDIDLCVVIGNLIDNATEACQLIQDEKQRFIRLYINTLKGQLYISISNSTNGKIKKINKRYMSTKTSGSHGFGLKRVDSIVSKYDGYINRQNEEGMFATEIMLPI